MKVWVLLLLAACGNTSGALLRFDAFAAGVAEARAPFKNRQGFDVTLSHARLNVAALYLNRTVPNWATTRESCTNPGIYVAQVFGPLALDLLDETEVPFPEQGEASDDTARAAEVWLVSGDISAPQSSEVVLELAGEAVRDGVVYPFFAQVTMGSNRAAEVVDPVRPNASPICFARIVSPIIVELRPRSGGALVLRADARAIVADVDFSTLSAAGDGTFVFADRSEGIAENALYEGLRSLSETYRFEWR